MSREICIDSYFRPFQSGDTLQFFLERDTNFSPSSLAHRQVPGARDPTHDKAIREKTWWARQIRFSGVSTRPAHKIPPMTRSQGESLTGKADQVFRGFEKLPPALTLKMISVFLMPASMDSDTGRKAFPNLFPNKNQFRTLINKFPRWWYFMRLFRVKGVF